MAVVRGQILPRDFLQIPGKYYLSLTLAKFRQNRKFKNILPFKNLVNF